ncbi:barstar family protein [Clostridium sp. Cult2]|uniref:barstar family protein n=1 Tax=Clostridium sp. Cult2 TaxID=2079003 RepID=UPI001F40AB67|nr:barstar family protein [Clostridium sp. Cult2]MCF6466035.1 hypothetical protein [Clostridium sp. Cult2]
MIKVTLDGKQMKTKETVHLYMKNALNSEEYYGNNLDALYDVLSTYSEPIEIVLINKDKLIENLGHYGKSLIKLLEDVEEENTNIEFKID